MRFMTRAFELERAEADVIVVPQSRRRLSDHGIDHGRLRTVPWGGRVELGEKDRSSRSVRPAGLFRALSWNPRTSEEPGGAAWAHRLAAPDLPLIIAGPDGWGEAFAPTAAVRAIGQVRQRTARSTTRPHGLPEPARGFGLPVLEAGAGDGGLHQRHHVDGGGGGRYRCAGRPDRPGARRRARERASDPDAWVERGRRASQQAALFTWAATGAALGAVYDEVAA